MNEKKYKFNFTRGEEVLSIDNVAESKIETLIGSFLDGSVIGVKDGSVFSMTNGADFYRLSYYSKMNYREIK